MAERNLVAEFTRLKENCDRTKEQLISAEASLKSKQESLDRMLKELQTCGVSSIEELKTTIASLEAEIASGIDAIQESLKEIS